MLSVTIYGNSMFKLCLQKAVSIIYCGEVNICITPKCMMCCIPAFITLVCNCVCNKNDCRNGENVHLYSDVFSSICWNKTLTLYWLAAFDIRCVLTLQFFHHCFLWGAIRVVLTCFLLFQLLKTVEGKEKWARVMSEFRYSDNKNV